MAFDNFKTAHGGLGPFQIVADMLSGGAISTNRSGHQERALTDQLIAQVQADKDLKGLGGIVALGQRPMSIEDHQKFRQVLAQSVASEHELGSVDEIIQSQQYALEKNAAPVERDLLDHFDRLRGEAQAALGQGDIAGAKGLLQQVQAGQQKILEQRYSDNAPVRQFQSELAAAGFTPGEMKRAWQDKLQVGDQQLAETLADGFASYRLPWPSGTQAKDPTMQLAMAITLQRHPDFQANLYETQKSTLQAFTTGKQGDIVRSLNVATSHLDLLGQATSALANGNSQLANQWMQKYNQYTGASAPTTFDALKTVVADEVTKAVVGGQAAEGDRERILEAIGRSGSPQQLAESISTFEHLMSEQLGGLRQQYQSSGRTDFDDRFLAPHTQQVLGQFAQPGGGGADGAPTRDTNEHGGATGAWGDAAAAPSPLTKATGAVQATADTVGGAVKWLSDLALSGLK